MSKTRHEFSEAGNIPLGEVVGVFLDLDGYSVSDPGSASNIKGGTVVATGSRNGYRKVIVAWTGDDTEIPVHCDTLNPDLLPTVLANLRLVDDIKRYTKYIQVNGGARVCRFPEATRIQAVKHAGKDCMVCSHCKEPVLQASPNMADGTFKCYSCRTNPYR